MMCGYESRKLALHCKLLKTQLGYWSSLRTPFGPDSFACICRAYFSEQALIDSLQDSILLSRGADIALGLTAFKLRIDCLSRQMVQLSSFQYSKGHLS